MQFTQLMIPGAFVIAPERHCDPRGFFARTFCRQEFAEHGLIGDFPQCSASYNMRRGTLRGMHFQRAPYQETKLVRCTRGAAFDVLLDLRPNAVTFGQWQAIELTQENGLAAYIPAGVAHGFQALIDDTELFYQISESYRPASSSGVRWDDRAFRIDWPIHPPILSARDAGFRDYAPARRRVLAHV